mgnify:CR=1 FL=1
MGIEWLEKRRKELKLTHEHIAEKIGRERSTTSRIMRGTTGFGVNDIPRLASALQVSVYDLLVGIGVLGGEVKSADPRYITISEEDLATTLSAVLDRVPDSHFPELWPQTIVGIARRVSERVRNDEELGDRKILRGFAQGLLDGPAPQSATSTEPHS